MKKSIYPEDSTMLSNHEIVYKNYRLNFPDADVYIATPDKVEGSKSPSIKEKQK